MFCGCRCLQRRAKRLASNVLFPSFKLGNNTSAQLCGLGITLASKSVDGKSNEIPGVQEMLTELDISGCMVVADALNCQKRLHKQLLREKGTICLV